MNKIYPTIVLINASSLYERVSDIAPTFNFNHREGTFVDTDVSCEELNIFLSHNSVPAPYILVGPSFSGFTALLYAHRYPANVSGIILVDSSHPKQTQLLLETLPEELPSNPEIDEFKTYLQGGAWWKPSCRIISKISPLGDLPTIVLAAGKPDLPDSLPLCIKKKLTSEWHFLQHDHAKRSINGEMRVIEGCGHAIASLRPDVVEKAIKDLINKC